jgi:hypothetical protein
MQIRKAKEIQRDVNSFQSEMDLLSQVAIQEQHKDSFETYETQYETLKQNIATHISTLEQKRRWSLCGGAAIIGMISIFLGVLLIILNTQPGELNRILIELYLCLCCNGEKVYSIQGTSTCSQSGGYSSKIIGEFG